MKKLIVILVLCLVGVSGISQARPYGHYFHHRRGPEVIVVERPFRPMPPPAYREEIVVREGFRPAPPCRPVVMVRPHYRRRW